MKPRNIYFTAFVAAMMVSCDAPQGEKIVIEGHLANVPDSMILHLTEWDGNIGERVATDTVVDGKFRFELESEIKGVHPVNINNYNIGLSTADFLWIEPGAKVKITGDGLDYSAWKIKSNVDVQKSENRFRKVAKEEYSLLCQNHMEYYPLQLRLYGSNDDDKWQRASEEEEKQMKKRLKELGEAQEEIHKRLTAKEYTLFADMTPDEAWLSRLYQLSRKAKYDKDTLALAQAKEQYARMDERLKNTFHGQGIANNLFPPQVVKVGDMIPNIELKDTLGNTHRLQDLKGKYLLLDFWSSGCGPCIMSFPELKSISEGMKDKVEVVSISEDGENMWRKSSAKHGITWHNWNDMKRNNGIFARFGVQGIPHYFIISPEGKILASQVGYGQGLLTFSLLPKYMDWGGKEPTYHTEGNKRIIDNPSVAEDYIDCMYISRVELTDKSTDVTFKVFYRPGWWIRVSDESHLITDSGEKLPVHKATGITFNKETYTPDSGTMEFTLHFPALSKGCASFSYYEEENKPNDCWRMIGVKVKG